MKLYVWLKLVLILVLIGCKVEVPELDPRITDEDLANEGKILRAISGVQLIDPITSPGYKKNPIIRVTGVKEGTDVSVYLTSACKTPIVTEEATSSIVDIRVPALSEGVYNFYIDQRNQFASSRCTQYPLQYEYQDSLPPPNNIELTPAFTTPSEQVKPSFLVKGVTSGATVSLYSDESCTIALGSETAYGSNVVIFVDSPGLNPGVYKIYTNQNFGGEVSNCSDVYADYEVESEIDAPTSMVLENPASSPSSDKTPSIRVIGVNNGYEVSLYRDPNCILQVGTGTGVGSVASVQITNELSDGVYQFFALQKNPTSGFKSPCSTATVTYQVDSTTRDISSGALLDPTSNVSNDSTPKVRIYGVESNAQVYLYRDVGCGSQIGYSATSSTQSYVDITTSTLSEGATNIYAKQIDSSGNISSCVGPLISYIYDKTVVAPTELRLEFPNFSPNTDDTPSIRIEGLEPGATAKLYIDSACTNQVGSIVATSVGANVTSSKLAVGTYNFYATQTDRAGNVSTCSTATVSYQVLGASVAEPTSLFLQSPSVSPSNSTSLEIGVSGLITGGHLYVFSDQNCNTQIYSATITGTTQYVIISNLAEGEYTYYARQADTQGSFSNCSNASVTYKVDLSAQAPSSISLVSPATTPSGDTTPTLLVSGVETNASVKLFKDSQCISEVGSATSSSDSVSINATLTESGTYSLYAKQTDSFGNVSSCSTAFVNYVLVIDGSTPSGLVMVDPASSDGNDTTPTVRVEGVTLGGIVYVYSDNNCTQVVASGTAIDTAIDLTVSEIATGDGNYKYYARQEINGGLSGCTSTPVEYNLDTVASKPSSLVRLEPAISPSSDNTPTIRVYGVEINATVSIYTDSDCSTKVGENSSSGTEVDVTTDELEDGSYSFYADQIDAVGNQSSCSTINVSLVVDKGASAPSSITLFSPSSSPDTDDTPEFTVSGIENAATVSIHTSSNCSAGSKIGQAISSGTSVVVEANPALSPGQYQVYAMQTDILGNDSACSATSIAYEVANGSGSVDPLYSKQWHLDNDGTVTGSTSGEDINVSGVWSSNKGADVHVRVVDDGLELSHPDLSINIKAGASWDFIGNDTDPTPSGSYDSHGTSCGGLIAAKDNNNIGVRGVAPSAKLSGYNLLQSNLISAESHSMSQNISTVDVSSNSWGPADGYGLFYEPSGSWTSAVETGLSSGRGGKGTVYVWAAGNGSLPDNSNHDGYANFYGVMSICGTRYDGTFADYSESGANLWVCAPTANLAHSPGKAIVTTDLSGSTKGQNTSGSSSDLADKDYTQFFGGTSASAPIVSGVAALVIKANPSLSWRDVKLILAQSARQNDPGNSRGSSNTWQTNLAGHSFNEDYGFGVVDADAAVTMATTWTNVGTFKNYTESIGASGVSLPYNSEITSSTTISGSGISKIEFIEVRVNLNHSDWGELDIKLERVGGLTSTLTKQHDCYNQSYTAVNCSVAGSTFRFGVAKHMGESADATWRLKVTDKENSANATGTLNSWSIKFYGE